MENSNNWYEKAASAVIDLADFASIPEVDVIDALVGIAWDEEEGSTVLEVVHQQLDL